MIRKMFRKPRPAIDASPDKSFAPLIEDAPVHDIPVVADEHLPAPTKPAFPRTNAPQQLPIADVERHIKADDLKTPNKPTWCAGCGDYSMFFALKKALQEVATPQENIVVVYGIGCHGHMCNFLHAYNFEGLHGRPIPVAEGIKTANNKLKVIVVAGDGDTYGEGMNHFLAGIRANHDVTLIVHNNMVYGLTTGQTSPTSGSGYKSKSTPDGVIETPVNPIALALSVGGSFVSRGFAGNVQHLSSLLVKAIQHDGFSVVDVLQNCVTFNKVNTIRWFNERVYDLQKDGHDETSHARAVEKSFEFGDRIPIGVFYQDARKSYQDELPAIQKTPLLKHPVEGIDLTKTFEKYV